MPTTTTKTKTQLERRTIPCQFRVRLEANDPRHADDNAPLPTRADAERVIEFTQALAQFLFVLPALVIRGRGTPTTSANTAAPTPNPAPTSTAEPTAPFPGTT